jgi:hypothetical protein
MLERKYTEMDIGSIRKVLFFDSDMKEHDYEANLADQARNNFHNWLLSRHNEVMSEYPDLTASLTIVDMLYVMKIDIQDLIEITYDSQYCVNDLSKNIRKLLLFVVEHFHE